LGGFSRMIAVPAVGSANVPACVPYEVRAAMGGSMAGTPRLVRSRKS
jgi:hypothetical protein